MARAAGALSAALGILVLAGWILNVHWIKSLVPGAVEMKANTAFALVCCGAALCLTEAASRRMVFLGRIMALAAAAIGIVTGMEYLLNWDAGIDQLVFRDTASAYNAIRGRMSPYSAAVFAAYGLGLMAMPSRSWRWLVWISATLTLLIGGVSFIGYLWSASELTTDLFLPPVAVNTAAAFVLLGIGALTAGRAQEGGFPALWASLSSVEARTVVGFVGTLLLLLISGGLTYRAAFGAAASAQWVAHTEEVRGTLHQIDAGLAAAELNERDYLLTRERKFEENCKSDAMSVHDDIAALVRLVSDNRAQTQRAKSLQNLVSHRLTALAAAGAAFEQSGLLAAQKVITEPAGLRLLAETRALIQEMDAAERELLTHRQAETSRDKARTLLYLLLTLAAAVAGFMVLFGGIRREMINRTRTERQVQQLNETLEYRVLERTAELNTANKALNQSAHRLTGQLARLGLLSETTRAIGERQDMPSICQVVVRSLEDHLPIDFGCVCLYDAARQALKVISVGLKSLPLAEQLGMTAEAQITIDENGLSRCVRGHLVYEADIAEVNAPFPQRLAKVGLRSLVVAPLAVESSIFGVLIAARLKPNAFDSTDCEFLKQLSEHTALAAHQAQLYNALQQAYDDLRQTQQAVMDQERLRALGQMASGIAHDINNAISPIALYTESLLETEPNLSGKARDYLSTIQHAIEDVAQTVARMKEFYRQRETQLILHPVALNPLIEQVVNLSRARWNDMPQQRGLTVELVKELEPNLATVMGVESEIREALINLIFNAVDAMPEGGRLTLRTQTVEDHVHVEVSDTGVGMNEETRRRCLEPFFTTKGERGTGLGLAMVYGTVRRHNASIELDSAVGKGTTVRLIFPVAQAPAALPTAQPVPTIPARARILLVDDDPMLIKSLRDTLETDGHLVTAATGGQAGIDAFLAAQEKGHAFAVVISDLGMPNIDGRKVSKAIKEASPATPIILLTGWGQRLQMEGDIPSSVDKVLSKPPKLRELREAIAACLTQDSTAKNR